jgi:CP family cyanate transporter-like MFS transporter
MVESSARSRRIAPYLGIMLVSLGLLTGVTSFPPIAGHISQGIGLTDVSYGLLGMLAPFTFGLMGLITPVIVRRVSLEWAILVAAALMGAGQLIRAFAGESGSFFAFSIVSMLGIGAANMLLPAVIKRFFPDKVVSVSTLYVVLLVFSSVYPPFFAVPIAAAAGWRTSIGVWAVIELVAVVPWIITIARARNSHAVEAVAPVTPGLAGRVWRHPSSWALLAGYAVAVLNFYVVVAWLPAMLTERTSATPEAAGAFLSLYTVVGIFTGFFIPGLVAKLGNLGILFIVNSVLMLAGYAGLLWLPATATWLWVVLAGTAPSLFSIVLVAVNYRTATAHGAVVLSGMATAGGYLLGAAGPLVVGLWRAQGLDWSAVLWMLIASTFVTIGFSWGLRRRVNVDE